jgi:hypothetical protein
MAKGSSDGSSLRKPGRAGSDEKWKTAPSRETTHDQPGSKDVEVEKARKLLENAPGLESGGAGQDDQDDEDDQDGQRR